MGLFGFLKKKKKDEMPLPPGKVPTLPKKAELPEIPSMSELEGTISLPKEAKEEAFELPELPEMKMQPELEEVKEAIEEERLEPTKLEFPEKLQIPSVEELPELEEFGELPPLEEVPEQIPELEEVNEEIPEEEPYHAEIFPIEEKTMPMKTEPMRTMPRLRAVKEPVTRKKGGPIFIEVNEFTNLIKDIETIKSGLKKADDSLLSLNDLKSKQDSGFEKLRGSMENIERKLIYVDNIIFEKR